MLGRQLDDPYVMNRIYGIRHHDQALDRFARQRFEAALDFAFSGLETTPAKASPEEIAATLEGPIAELVRKDKRFGELGLKPDDYTTREAVIALLIEHPELMQRPIVMRAGRAVIARPPEKLLALL